MLTVLLAGLVVGVAAPFRISSFNGSGTLAWANAEVPGICTVVSATNAGVDGADALTNAFYGARGVWSVPTGGYLLSLHDGAQLWYIDAANISHLLVNGEGENVYVQAGDGQFFYNPTQLLIGEGRSVTMDWEGNIIMCESDYGFVRRIRFRRLAF
jgi:hypothetical protein